METPASPIAIITGGTSGIGLACARRLLSAGHRVAVFSQQNRRVEEARTVLATSFGEDNVIADTVDIRSAEEIARFVRYVVDQWGTPSVLVCSAGYSPKRNGTRTRFEEIPSTNGTTSFPSISRERWCAARRSLRLWLPKDTGGLSSSDRSQREPCRGSPVRVTSSRRRDLLVSRAHSSTNMQVKV